jgi:hypothetical protein
MSEPAWSLPFNRAELIARVAALEALLARALATGQLHPVRNSQPPHLADEMRSALEMR